MVLELFRRMVVGGVKLNEIIMVSVFFAIVFLGSLKEVKWVYDYIKINFINFNDNLIVVFIDVYVKCGSISNVLDVFNLVRDRVTIVLLWNAIICGLVIYGYAILLLFKFEDFEKSGIRFNLIIFVGVLIVCCYVGLVEVGEDFFERMKNVYKIEFNIKYYGCMVDFLGRVGRL